MSNILSLTLVTHAGKPDVNKCILRKKINEVYAKDTLTNAPWRRNKIIESFRKLNDGLLSLLNEVETRQVMKR